jgi:hypothetical protein
MLLFVKYDSLKLKEESIWWALNPIMLHSWHDVTTIILKLIDLIDDAFIKCVVQLFVLDLKVEDIEVLYFLLLELFLT